MLRRIMTSLWTVMIGAALTFGGVAALESRAGAQITVRCWREYCTTDPDTKKTYCVKEEIPCPEEEA